MTTKPVCREYRTWVRERLGNKVFAPFTSADSRAFSAFTHLLEVYVSTGETSDIVEALRATVKLAQPSCWPAFKAAIPAALDWSNEDPLWELLTDPCAQALREFQKIQNTMSILHGKKT